MRSRPLTDDYGVSTRGPVNGGSEPVEGEAHDLRLMARSLGWLFTTGACLAALTLILPHAEGVATGAIVAVLGSALVVGILLLSNAGRVPAWLLSALVAIGTVHISLASYFSDERPSPLILFYLWIFLYSAYFFSRRELAAQVAFVALNLGLLLALREPASGAESWWLVGLGSMLVAAALVTAMRDRASRLISSLHQAARERERARRELSLHRDHLEQLVDERTAALQVAYRELEAFSYSVSHDLRAPLRSLDGFSQAMIEDYGDRLDEQGRDYLGRIRAASQRMSLLIDDILQLARLARSEMRREPVDLSALAGSVAEELRQLDPGRRVELRIGDGLAADADERLLRIVLSNLIGNAWKFTSQQPGATIEVGRANSGPEQAYFVRDNGVGFDMEYADKLFGAFQRLHSSAEFEGTGIGLATVQRAIHRHGGRVWAESEPDRGATFFFTLPTARKDES